MINDSEISSLFLNKSSNVLKIYETILSIIKNIGPVIIEPKKTSIHLKSKSAFGGVHPKRKWLDFNLVMDHKLDDERIIKTDKVSANRFHHYFRFNTIDDIDNSFISLLRKSYQLMS